MKHKDDILKLETEFKACQKALVAIGDEIRQHILMIMMEGECRGSRVIDIAKLTNLSRPAVSHHMQILKDAEFISVRKEGTKYYYYLNVEDSVIDNLISLLQNVKSIMAEAPNRSGDE